MRCVVSMVSNRYTLFSLFSGAGGMDGGFSQHGKYRLIFANDIRPRTAETYCLNFNHTLTDVAHANKGGSTSPSFILGDVSEIDFDAIPHDDVDVIVGGPPCQDFSIVRGPQKERKGIDVKRGRLYAQFVRALIHVQPKAFVFENVPGLKSANGGAAYRTIEDDFSKLKLRWSEIEKQVGNRCKQKITNYELVFSDVIDPANLGVPQRRRRLIIIGLREDVAPKELGVLNQLKESVHSLLTGKDKLFGKYPLTSLETFEGKPLNELDAKYSELMKDYAPLAECPFNETAIKWKRTVWDALSFDCEKDYFKTCKLQEVKKDEWKRAVEEHKAVLVEMGYYNKKLENAVFNDGSNLVARESPTVLQRMYMIPPDQNHDFVRSTAWEVEGKGMSLIYRRLHPLKPSYTVVAFGGGGTWGYHYERHRGRLTNRERARLQTFSDDLRFYGNESEVRAQIGEAVPSLLGKRIASAVETLLVQSR